MRKLIVSNFVSLEGFFEGPKRELDWHVLDGDFLTYAKDMLRSAWRGNPLFKGIKQRLRLNLHKTKLFGSGVIVLYYQKA